MRQNTHTLDYILSALLGFLAGAFMVHLIGCGPTEYQSQDSGTWTIMCPSELITSEIESMALDMGLKVPEWGKCPIGLNMK